MLMDISTISLKTEPKILKSRAFERIEYVGYPCDLPGVESMKEAGSICVLIVGQSCSSTQIHAAQACGLMRDVRSSQYRAALTDAFPRSHG